MIDGRHHLLHATPHMNSITFFIRRLPRSSALIVFACVLSCTAVRDLSAQIDASEITELVRTSDRNGSAVHERMNEYKFNSRITLSMADKRGKVKQNVFESYPPLSERQTGKDDVLYILVIKENTPVKPAKIQSERVRAQKQIEKIRRERAKGQGSAPPPPNRASYYKFSSKIANLFGLGARSMTLSPSSILQNCQFVSQLNERLADHETISLEFHSCTSDGLSADERFITNFAGKVWIDVADKVMVRLEGWPQADMSGKVANPPSVQFPKLIYEQVMVADGQWLPRRVLINNGTNVGFKYLLGVESLEFQIEFSDYTR